MKHLFVPERPPAVLPTASRRPRRRDRRVPARRRVSRQRPPRARGQAQLRAPTSASPASKGLRSRPRQFSSVYYDTADRLLARIGITLRRRLEHGGSLWQLKLPRSGGRLELEHPVDLQRPRERIASSSPRCSATAHLAPVAELRTIRRGVRVEAKARPPTSSSTRWPLWTTCGSSPNSTSWRSSWWTASRTGSRPSRLPSAARAPKTATRGRKFCASSATTARASRHGLSSRHMSRTSTSRSWPMIPAQGSATTLRIFTTCASPSAACARS